MPEVDWITRWQIRTVDEGSARLVKFDSTAPSGHFVTNSLEHARPTTLKQTTLELERMCQCSLCALAGRSTLLFMSFRARQID